MNNVVKGNLCATAKCRRQMHAWMDRYFDALEAQLASQLQKRAPEPAASQPEICGVQSRAEQSTAGITHQQDAKLEEFFRTMRRRS